MLYYRFAIPEDCTLAMPPRTFIEQDQNQQSHYRGTRQLRKRIARVFNDKGIPTMSISRPGKELKKNRNEIYEVLEEQKMLLQSLALKENIVKGLSGYEQVQSLSQANLNLLKEDTCLMLHHIWNQNGRK